MVKFVEASDPAFIAAAKVGAFKGAVLNLQNSVYHALDQYWSSTDLKTMYEASPAHFKQKYFETKLKDDKLTLIRKPKPDKKPTYEMILGSLVHCLMLAPHDFEAEFFRMPDLNLRTNDGKAEKERLLTENSGKLAITDEMLVQANNMRSSLQANKRVMELLSAGHKEMSFFWTCKFSGLNFKAKLDQASSKHFCEMKTTGSADSEAFSKKADDMNYDLSLIHYSMGMKEILQLEPPVYFIVVEQDEPHVTQVYRAGQGFLVTGHAKWLSAVTKLETGIKKNEWPGYFPEDMEMTLEPPPWAVKKLMKEERDGI